MLTHKEPYSMLLASNIVRAAPLSTGKASYMMLFDIESGLAMAPPKRRNWKAEIKGMLKAELARQSLRYADLAERLAATGVRDNELNLKNKINRGTFSAVFFVQCLRAIGCTTVHLGDE